MKLINKINIEYFRSLKSVHIENINHLNIFSGKNDIGKSNILKALDIFFNKKSISFIDDFNKERLNEVRKESIKGRQYIRITIEFINPGGYKTLPKYFSVSKTWDRKGNMLEGVKDNFDFLEKKGKYKFKNKEISRRSLTALLNRIRYTYIPAIRDEMFFSSLLNKLQETIFEVEERKNNYDFQDKIVDFNDTVKKLTEKLNEEFKIVSGVSSSLSFPNNIAEIFQRLIIDTDAGVYKIPLKLRGDGIRLRYIPTILNYISQNSRFIEIWGFDEPENSCEYSLSNQVARQFVEEYSKKTQIFVTSHSFHFIAIEDDRTSKYRVFRTNEDINTQIVQIDKVTSLLLDENLGILDINKKLSALYTSMLEEKKQMDEIKNKITKYQLPHLIFEGKTDNLLFKIAYSKLFNEPIDNYYKLCDHTITDSGTSVGSGARFVNEFLINHISKISTDNTIIAVFDADFTGVNEIKALKKIFVEISNETEQYYLFQHKFKKNVYAMTLVTPEHRKVFFSKKYPQYCYITTELLLDDMVISNDNRKYPTLFDKTVFSFQGNKNAFAERIELNKETIDFKGFKPTFDLISKIITFNE
ncbi:AAA family ATPase [Parabacteroides sp.]|uniref:ATP-dependent nuclease n=1 Tax=Parabacteroides sp. TaxID=1869337 RepID=UPI0030801643